MGGCERSLEITCNVPLGASFAVTCFYKLRDLRERGFCLVPGKVLHLIFLDYIDRKIYD